MAEVDNHNASFGSSSTTTGSSNSEHGSRSRRDNPFSIRRQRSLSNSRGHEMFYPKSSHIHTPRRSDADGNCDKITRFASPDRQCTETEVITRVPQSYLTSLSAVSSSKKVFKRRSSDEARDTTPTSNASGHNVSFAVSEKSGDSVSPPDSWERRRTDKQFRSMPYRSSIRSEKLDALTKKAYEIVEERKQKLIEFRNELHGIQVGKKCDRDSTKPAINNQSSGRSSPIRTPTGSSACSREKLCSPSHGKPPRYSLRSIPTPPLSMCDSQTDGGPTSVSPVSNDARQRFFSSTPEIASSRVDLGKSVASGSSDSGVARSDRLLMTSGSGLSETDSLNDPCIKVVVTSEHCHEKKANYYQLLDKFNATEVMAAETTDAMNEMKILQPSNNGNVGKKSLSATISNFIKKMSPRLHRKSKSNADGSKKDADSDSSSASMNSSQASQTSSPAHSKTSRGKKSPVPSPIRKLMPSGKRSRESRAGAQTQAPDKSVTASAEKGGNANDSSARLMLKSISDNNKNIYTDFKEKQSSKLSPTDARGQSSPMRAIEQHTAGAPRTKSDVFLETPKAGVAAVKNPPQSLNVRNVSQMRKKLVHNNVSTESIGDCSLDVNIDANLMGSEPSISSGQSGQHSLISKRSVISQDNLTLGSGNNSTKQNCAGELKSTSEYELSAMTITQPVREQPGVNTASKGHSVNCSNDSTDKYYSADNNNRSNAVELSTTTTTTDAVTLLATDSSVITNKLLDSNVQTHGIVSSENSDINNGYSKRTILPNGGAINDDDVFVTASTDKVGNGVVQGGCNRTVSNSSDQFPVDKKVSINAQKTVIPEAKRKDSILDKDGHFFIAMTHRHTEKITARCDETERYLIQTDVPEEACGKIRAAIGKAHLLTSKRFQQFIGLCQENLHPKGGHSPTIQDLAGFWDMVYLQVEDVSNSFDEIEEMKENDWKEVENSQFKKRSSSCSSQKSVNSVDNTETKAPAKTRTQKRPTKQKSEAEKVREEAARKTREEARKRLMQAKRAARKRLLSGGHEQEAAIEIFVPENT